MTQPQAPQSPGRTPSVDSPTVPLPNVSSKVTCHVCGTTFKPKETDGKCPVCGEQVVRPGATQGGMPLVSPFLTWLRGKGNWRIAALAILVVYEIVLFIVLWIHLAQVHAL